MSSSRAFGIIVACDRRTKQLWHGIRSNLNAISIVTYALFCFFGLGSWVAINGVWAQLPVLTVSLPECYKLASILTVIIQVANIGPLAYTITKLLWRKLDWNQFNLEVCAVFLLVVIGTLSCVLLALFWRHIAVVGTEEHSVALISLIFMLSLVDCTSSVVFVPFMKHFPVVYLSGLYIGEGLSGVLPSVIALIQGSANNSIGCGYNYSSYTELGINFSTNVYFALLAVLMFLCGAAFLGLLGLPWPRKERAKTKSHIPLKQEEDNVEPSKVHVINYNKHPRSADQAPLMSSDDDSSDKSNVKVLRISQTVLVSPTLTLGRQVLIVLYDNAAVLSCIFLISFLTNGSLSSVSSFAFGAYTNQIFHVAVNLGLIANPMATLLFALLPAKSRILTAFLTIVAYLFGVYMLAIALMHSDPPLKGITGGVVIVS